MAKMKFFSDGIELTGIHTVKRELAQRAWPGLLVKGWDYYSRIVGHPLSGPDAIYPCTRIIEYKANPSLHKCDGRCMHAKGRLCECSCGGANHGRGR